MQIIQGLSQVYKDYDALLVDAWGVIHDGVACFTGAQECLSRLAKLDIPVIVVSNAARRHDAMDEELQNIGIHDALYRNVVSSGELTWQGMHANKFGFGTNGFYLGPSRSSGLCRGLDVRWVASIDDADFVLNTGAPEGNPKDTESLLPILEKFCSCKLPMICANPDQMAIRGGEAGISAGAIARRYQSMCGEQVIYVGKPHMEIFAQAVECLSGIVKSKILMVGDAFATDIRGAADFGIDSLLIADGIHRDEMKPFCEETILHTSAQYDVLPGYVSQSFHW